MGWRRNGLGQVDAPEAEVIAVRGPLAWHWSSDPEVVRSSDVSRTPALAAAATALVATLTALLGGVPLIDTDRTWPAATAIRASVEGAAAPDRLAEAEPTEAAIPPVVEAPGPTSNAIPIGVPATGGIQAPVPEAPRLRGALPTGKGMWIWLPERAEGGDVTAIVGRAKSAGLTHLYVRTGSSRSGLTVGFLDRLLPVAHEAGLRVYGWDFTYFENVDADVARATAAITHLTAGGHRIDGFVADIETRSEGVNLSPVHAFMYGQKLRAVVGADYPLIACVPRPSHKQSFPYAEATAAFDAIAPMVYWLNRDPATDAKGAVEWLTAKFGKPVIPVGQAYDGAADGGPPGKPTAEQLRAFMASAEDAGAVGVSFWSWQHADETAWSTIRAVGHFTLPTGDPRRFTPGQVRAYQALLGSLGFPGNHLPRHGAWDGPTAEALAAYQRAAGLPVTGTIDPRTREVLLKPISAPLPPAPSVSGV